MKRTTFNAIGGWQPFLFCIGMYVVALMFSIFVCSSIFYVINSKSSDKDAAKVAIVPTNAGSQLASVNH
ncbi:MAG: hypothetical protein BGO55_28575 [Sphingobacteriales bacterium 50-39]|nr:hypothetical protein [Sphingobacteriales bacterium]OJW60519.1 MAG: hypothetical protein BGO55_28575 [Sphingobacteriales bacterium 50-39]